MSSKQSIKKSQTLGLDIGFLGLMSVVTILTRWWYHSAYLFHWDSVQFALAFQGIDILRHRPHPPGYILYVWLGQLFKLLTRDDNLALVVLSITASVVIIVLGYYLAVRIFKNRLAGVLAVTLLVANTSVAFHGMVGEVYPTETAWILGVLFLFYLYLEKPTLNRLLPAVVIFGLLGGIRQTSELALVPAIIYVLIITKTSLRSWLIAAGVLIAANLVWIIPVLHYSGGLQSYIQSIVQLSKVVLWSPAALSNGLWARIAGNLKVMGDAFKMTLSLELIAGYLALSPLIIRQNTKVSLKTAQLIWMFGIALAGMMAIVALTVMTNIGYVLGVTVLILIGLAGGLSFLYHTIDRQTSRRGAIRLLVGIIVILVGYQIYQFYRLAPDTFAFISPSRQSIKVHDELMEGLINGVKNNSHPDETAIWVDSPQTMVFFDIRHLQYYLPGYDVYRILPDSIIHPSTLSIWHANGTTFEQFEPEVMLSKKITKLFFIRTFWNEEHGPYQIPTQISKDRFIVYYDLTQSNVRQYLTEQYKFKFNY